MEKLNKLLDYLQKIADTSYIATLMHWEMDITAPKKSLDYLIDVKTKVELKAFELSTSEEYKRLLDDLINSEEHKTLTIEEQRFLTELKDDYERDARVPASFYKEYSSLCSKSNAIWVESKEKKDYQIFKPYLEKIIDMTKKYYLYRYPDTTNLYDCMLNEYECGITSETIDKLFTELKQEIIPIVKNLKVTKIGKPQNKYTNEELLDIATYLLDYIGFDNERGALGIYPHGYTCKLNNNDVRITFSNNKSIFDHVCTVIHEGGHGIFEQSIGSNLSKYPIYNIGKYALHESQSRFFENILGRNINFWIPIYDNIKSKLKLDIPVEEFVSYLNKAEPSFIRTEADELTYCLHIIIRYEIERDLFSNKISVNELPLIWNQKMQEYLGIQVNNDSDGILQDVHWSQGSFGYFPSYLIGSIFDGMLIESIEKNIGSIDEILRQGQIKKITKYLQDNIHKNGGAFTIKELTAKLCNQELTITPLVKYFKTKYENKEG